MSWVHLVIAKRLCIEGFLSQNCFLYIIPPSGCFASIHPNSSLLGFSVPLQFKIAPGLSKWPRLAASCRRRFMVNLLTLCYFFTENLRVPKTIDFLLRLYSDWTEKSSGEGNPSFEAPHAGLPQAGMPHAGLPYAGLPTCRNAIHRNPHMQDCHMQERHMQECHKQKSTHAGLKSSTCRNAIRRSSTCRNAISK